jgi:hypothetical protein
MYILENTSPLGGCWPHLLRKIKKGINRKWGKREKTGNKNKIKVIFKIDAERGKKRLKGCGGVAW